MVVETKCKLNNAELFLQQFYIQVIHQSKEIRNKKYYEENKENLKHGKVRFRLNIDVRKEKEDSRMNAVKTKAKVAFAKVRPTEFEQQQQPIPTLWSLF